MKAPYRIATWAIALQVLLTFNSRAELQFIPPLELKLINGESLPSFILINIRGSIAEQDTKSLLPHLVELDATTVIADLDSPGGEVLAAMEIGRILRKYEASTSIALGGKCYSSCALIFMAGVRRYNPQGALGLHRPYLASSPQPRQTVEKQVPLMLSLVRQYIAEMGITDNVYQQMVNTEPSQMAIYRNQDFKKIIPAVDPVYQEVETSYDARRYGVTTSEMRRREINAEQCWNQKNAYNDWRSCQEAKKWGLSERVYRARSGNLPQCRADVQFLETLPKKGRRDHPLWLKQEACERRVMLDRQ